jgi:hypothetical protein
MRLLATEWVREHRALSIEHKAKSKKPSERMIDAIKIKLSVIRFYHPLRWLYAFCFMLFALFTPSLFPFHLFLYF